MSTITFFIFFILIIFLFTFSTLYFKNVVKKKRVKTIIRSPAAYASPYSNKSKATTTTLNDDNDDN